VLVNAKNRRNIYDNRWANLMARRGSGDINFQARLAGMGVDPCGAGHRLASAVSVASPSRADGVARPGSRARWDPPPGSEPSLDRNVQRQLGRCLKAMFDELEHAPVPAKLEDLLDRLEQQERRGEDACLDR